MLGAILLSPPTTAGTATHRNLARGATALNESHYVVGNMFGEPTRDLIEVNLLGQDPQGWLAARPELQAVLQSADDLIIGWGVRGFTGVARDRLADQVAWLASEALAAGHASWWALGGLPRHPSRWHQYLSEKHGVAAGASFESRFRSRAALLQIRSQDNLSPCEDPLVG